jgi:hypothetical protein
MAEPSLEEFSSSQEYSECGVSAEILRNEFYLWGQNTVQVCQETENNAGTLQLSVLQQCEKSTRCCQQSTDANGGHLKNL